MKDDEINLAIAEACGWRSVRELDDLYPDGSVAAGVWWQGIDPVDGQERVIPDYCNDLNAMHEALRHLPRELKGKMVDTVWQIMPTGTCMEFDLLTAEPYYLAEAFLRTIGKWKEDS